MQGGRNKIADNIKSFTIATVFIFVCSVALLYFALGYPALNGQQSVLIENPAFNQTAENLADSLGEYQTTQNVRVNLSSFDDPQTTAEGVILGTTTANVRNTMGELTATFVIITGLLGNVFGLSGGQFGFISGALLSLFSVVLLYYLIKMIRYGL